MKLHGMADAFHAQLETADEPARIRETLRAAGGPAVALEKTGAGAVYGARAIEEAATIEDVDYSASPQADRSHAAPAGEAVVKTAKCPALRSTTASAGVGMPRALAEGLLDGASSAA